MSSKEKNYSFSPALFTDYTGDSLTFVIKPCKEKESLRDMIEFGGGEVVSTPGDHGITLIPPEVDVTNSDEVYSTEYIKDCCARSKLQDLKPYRLNATSKFPDNFDVMRVMLKFTSWSEPLKGPALTERCLNIEPSDSDTDIEMPGSSPAVEEVYEATDGLAEASEDEIEQSGDGDNNTRSSKQQQTGDGDNNTRSSKQQQTGDGDNNTRPSKQQQAGDGDNNTRPSKQQQSNLRSPEINSSTEVQSVKASSSSCSPDGEIVSDDDDDDELWNMPSKRPKRGLTSRRRDYSRKERLAIINFITKFRCHSYVKGREMWQKAEAAKICNNRTWQSMKEHFIKKIIPNIRLYDLSEEEVNKFQKPFR